MCYMASIITRVPIHLIREDHIIQAIEYQDDARGRLSGLKEAVKKWEIWPNIE
jgi:hypothetical protein